MVLPSGRSRTSRSRKNCHAGAARRRRDSRRPDARARRPRSCRAGAALAKRGSARDARQALGLPLRRAPRPVRAPAPSRQICQIGDGRRAGDGVGGVELENGRTSSRGPSTGAPRRSPRVHSVTASGTEPPVRPFDRHRMSGATPACSQANSVPVRPQPVITSSAMSSTPWRAADRAHLGAARPAGTSACRRRRGSAARR